jgi:hypothetical protein
MNSEQRALFRLSSELEAKMLVSGSVGAEAVSGEVIELPANDVRRLKLLQIEIEKRLCGRIDQDAGNKAAFLNLKNLGKPLKIDDCALIDTFPGDEYLYFILQTKTGLELPLVTKDIKMMADFVCMYILARLDQLSESRLGIPAEDVS